LGYKYQHVSSDKIGRYEWEIAMGVLPGIELFTSTQCRSFHGWFRMQSQPLRAAQPNHAYAIENVT
jgi:hypothetical protein